MDAPLLNSTLPRGNETCPPTNTLSGGSAAFIHIALVLGTLAQPAGSLVLPNHSGARRAWRFSSLLCGLEGITILVLLLLAPLKEISQRERAFTILAKRTTASHDETRTLKEYLERPKLELIVPMMLQIWKIVFIRGSWITTVLAVLWWLDWAVVQYCHCWVWFHPFREGRARCKHNFGLPSKQAIVRKPDWPGVCDQIETIKRITQYTNPVGAVILYLTAFSTGILSFYFPAVIWVDESWSPWVIIAVTLIEMCCLFGLLCMSLPNAWFLFDTRAQHIPNQQASARSASAASGFIAMVFYYMSSYNASMTYKPDWLDWFG